MMIWLVVGWLATLLSFFGIVLNGRKNIWCWLVWIISNAFWMALGIHYRDSAMIGSQVGFFVLNVYGWLSWAKKERGSP